MFEKKQEFKEINSGILREIEPSGFIFKEEIILNKEEQNRQNLIKEIKEGKLKN